MSAENVTTIHEITQSKPKPHERSAALLVLFHFLSRDFVGCINPQIEVSLFQQPCWNKPNALSSVACYFEDFVSLREMSWFASSNPGAVLEIVVAQTAVEC